MNAPADELLNSCHKYIATFRHKAVVLREIHSNLAQKCRGWDLWFTVATIFLISFTAFLGFSGVENVHAALMSYSFLAAFVPEPKTFNFIFNFCIFIIFFGSLLNLIFRWKENHTTHFQGVVRLTHFINWLDEQKVLNKSFDEQLIKDISNRYAAILDILPPNNSEDYIKAKQSLASKNKSQTVSTCNKIRSFFNKRSSSRFFQSSALASQQGEHFFKELIFKSPLILPLLKCMRDTDERFWLGGGMIRNYVWDSITGRATPIHDIDVIYFDDQNTSELVDTYYEKQLNNRAGLNLRWSVKNQVRMYKTNKEGDVRDLEEAVANWPETATAIVIRLDGYDNLHIIAPYGLQDLFSMNIKPTPKHKENKKAYEHRLVTKKWKEHWPELIVTE